MEPEEGSKSSKHLSKKAESQGKNSDSGGSPQQAKKPSKHESSSSAAGSSKQLSDAPNLQTAFGRNQKDLPQAFPRLESREQPSQNGHHPGRVPAQLNYQSARKSELDFTQPQEPRNADQRNDLSKDKKTESMSSSNHLSDNGRQQQSEAVAGWATEELDWDSPPKRGKGHRQGWGGGSNQGGQYPPRSDMRYGDKGNFSRSGNPRGRAQYQNHPQQHLRQNTYNQPTIQRGDHRYQRASFQPGHNHHHQHAYHKPQTEARGLIDENARRKGETLSVYDLLKHSDTLEEFLKKERPDPGHESLKSEGNLVTEQNSII